MTPKNQTFRELYHSLPPKKIGSPKHSFIIHIASITKKTEKTVRGWIAGAYVPDLLSQSVIEKDLGISSEILFPKKKN